MSERVTEIEYKGRTIVYCDLSNGTAEDIKTVTAEVDQLIIDKGTTDQLFLVNIEDCAIDAEGLKCFKESSQRIQPYLKAGASFGLTGLKPIFLNAINRVSGINVTAHSSMEEAKEYLIRESYK
jgi:hypothetical protein